MADQNDCPELDRAEHPYVFSASQIETAMLCMRKWAFDKIDRIPRTDSEATLLGSAVHNQVENYLRDGTPFDTKKLEGKIAMSGLKHFPAPKTPGLLIEEWFVRKYPTISATEPTYWGKKDAQHLEGMYGLEMPIVWDHKTCSSFRYMPSADELVLRVQPGMYAWDAMEAAKRDIAQLRWTYMKTKGGRASLPVVTCITRMQAEDTMARVDEVSRKLIILKQELSQGEAIAAPPSFSACAAYGGCEHRDRCKPTAASTLDAIMTDKTDTNLLASLRSRKKGAVAAASPEVAEKKAADAAATTDKVNPPERKEQKPPPPPEARQVGDEWFQPNWDNAEWEWKFPAAYHEAVAAEEARKAEEDKAAKSAAKKKTNGAKKKSAEVAVSSDAAGLLDAFIELLAERVVEKLEERK